MAIREIITLGHPTLRQKARKVTKFGPELQQLIDDMIETMRAAPGVGLAASQVNVPERVIVVDACKRSKDWKALVAHTAAAAYQGKPLEGPLPPDHPFATKDLMHYAYDLKEANRILDEAGYKPDASGVRFKATIDAPTFSPDGLGRVADWLKPQLKKIGIEIERAPRLEKV